MENKEQESIRWYKSLGTTYGDEQHDKSVLVAERKKKEMETKKGQPTKPVGGRRTRKRKIRKKRKTKRKKTKTKRKRRKTKSRKRRKYK